jgi:hypothetical protein
MASNAEETRESKSVSDYAEKQRQDLMFIYFLWAAGEVVGFRMTSGSKVVTRPYSVKLHSASQIQMAL